MARPQADTEVVKATILILLVGLCLVGFRETIAGWFWPRSPAPWETVDAFYYPSKTNLPVDRRKYDMPSIESCRLWIFQQAALSEDPKLEHGDYECGVGFMQNVGDLRMYRLSLR